MAGTGGPRNAAVVTGRLPEDRLEAVLAAVAEGDDEHRRGWPGAAEGRRPVSVRYISAAAVGPRTARDDGNEALRLLAAHAPDPATFARATGCPDVSLAALVRERVVAKLETEPLEDLRVDFEDGYLGRDDAQEDADAEAAGRALAAAAAEGLLPPFYGLRVKSFTDGLARRSARTLDRFLGALLEAAGTLPSGFVITFPKIVSVRHVEAFVELLAELEAAHGLPAGVLGFEAQIETTPSVLHAEGGIVLRRLRAAGGGRLRSVHVGVYDYSAALGLPPAEQRLDHPALDFLRNLLQVTFAGTEVALVDGSTNVVPAGDEADEVHRTWRRHAADVRHSLRHGWWQGWDLHPSHLVSRYAAVYEALLADLDGVLDRLGAWHGSREARGGVLDEPATARALTAQVQRAVDCGAVAADEVLRRTGWSPAER